MKTSNDYKSKDKPVPDTPALFRLGHSLMKETGVVNRKVTVHIPESSSALTLGMIFY